MSVRDDYEAVRDTLHLAHSYVIQEGCRCSVCAALAALARLQARQERCEERWQVEATYRRLGIDDAVWAQAWNYVGASEPAGTRERSEA